MAFWGDREDVIDDKPDDLQIEIEEGRKKCISWSLFLFCQNISMFVQFKTSTWSETPSTLQTKAHLLVGC